MADRNSTGRSWDHIVAPWHLNEHIPAFPVPAGVAETIGPALPAGPVPGRMNLLHQAVADAVARTARPLLLSGDCPSARGAIAGLQRRHRDLAVVRTTADLTAAGIACAWLPERVSDQATRQAITRLAGALGADLTWHEPADR